MKEIKPTKNEKEISAPKETTKGKAAKFVSNLISDFIPGGATLINLFQLVVSPSMERRKEEWQRIVTETINEIQKSIESFELSNLKDDEEFISLLLETYPIVIKNHQKEKVELLKNALYNGIVDKDLKFDLKSKFLSLIDELSFTHFKVLTFYQTNNEIKGIEEYEFFFEAYKEENKGTDLTCNQFVYFTKDLKNKELLIISQSVHGGEQAKVANDSFLLTGGKSDELPTIITSEIGNDLLKYVKKK